MLVKKKEKKFKIQNSKYCKRQCIEWFGNGSMYGFVCFTKLEHVWISKTNHFFFFFFFLKRIFTSNMVWRSVSSYPISRKIAHNCSTPPSYRCCSLSIFAISNKRYSSWKDSVFLAFKPLFQLKKPLLLNFDSWKNDEQ